MKVRIDDLPIEGRTFEVEVGPGALAAALKHTREPDLVWPAPARGTVALHKEGRSLRVQGDAAFRVVEPCARCLAEVDQTLVTHFDLTKVLGARPSGTPRTREMPEDEVDEDYLDEPEIDLDQVLLEQIALEMPLRLLCSEACKGLCPHCGANLNVETCRCETEEVDPRFAVLKKLKLGDDSGET